MQEIKEILIKLDNINKVMELVNIITPFEGDLDLIEGRYTVDAKTIMGNFSRNLANPLLLKVHELNEDVMRQLEKFVFELGE